MPEFTAVSWVGKARRCLESLWWEAFGDFSWGQTPMEPTGGGCNDSVLRCSNGMTRDGSGILSANPTVGWRVRMTVRPSCDECRTWPVSKLITAGP